MSLRASTMSPANASYDRAPSHLLRKLVLLFLLVTAAALGGVLLFRQKPDFPILLFSFFTIVTLGLIAGLGVRTVLRDAGGFVRGMAAAALVVTGLGLLGYFTEWQLGIGPLEFGRTTVDWLDLTQMVIGIDTAWITMRAWQSSAVRTVPATHNVVSRPRRRRAVQASGAAAPRVQLPRSWSLWPKPRVRANPAVRSRAATRGAPVLTFQKAQPQPIRPKRRTGLFRRRPQVQLAVTEEHRCPYCLDIVMRSDPRGTRECDVCHTLHHADCWAITGVCQVPHLNT
jgi:hypothetical protein